ncbi:FHA domain-containing protein [Coleofasciculus sp. LEGE 07081]|uniref:FHA domain-containing protein n=1 Tax=Coleofasciculus sp. LEGE 07081 TaxID=2777967 RepID=UPI001882A481|nr:FHA domain-containing protein [Coleofasciculus sp. LEGE 07081]MBE9125416.1 FHA domain-containing protein [Coleofasciculus sp. LEGE 07081]
MYIQLRWEDPETGEVKRSLLVAPIAVGREADQMPEQWGGRAVSRLELVHQEISRFHALISVENNKLYVTDQQSANGTFLNGRRVRQSTQPFGSKDTLRIGPYKMTATLMRENDLNATAQNPDQSNLSPPVKSLSKNTLIVWTIGVGVLLLAGFGAWAAFSALLEQSRPQVPTTPTPKTSYLRQGRGMGELGKFNC